MISNRHGIIRVISTAFCLFLLVASMVQAAEEIEVRTVTSIGSSRQEAIINGLIEVIHQTQGVSVDSTQALRTSFHQVFGEENGQTSEDTEITQNQERAILTKAKGYIKAYKVLSIHRLQDRTGWEATIRVEIPRYEGPGISPKSRRSLAVLPVKSTLQSYSIFDQSILGADASHKLTQHLVNQFTQSRRFTVLDRESMAPYLDEKRLLLSGDALMEEQLKLGQVLGTDYMLIVELFALEAHQQSHENKLIGKNSVNLYGSVSVNFRVAVAATRQIKWSDSLTLTFNNDSLLALAHTDTVESVADGLLSAAADAVATASLDNIYPLQIVALRGDGGVVLNQGGIRLKVGDILDVYAKGEQVTEVYSKESLGRLETWIAQIQIEKVLPKMSEGFLIQGDYEKVAVGNILRKVPAGQRQEAPVQQKTRQGVKLPFD